jgi:hypothetical protein
MIHKEGLWLSSGGIRLMMMMKYKIKSKRTGAVGPMVIWGAGVGGISDVEPLHGIRVVGEEMQQRAAWTRNHLPRPPRLSVLYHATGTNTRFYISWLI